MAITANYLMKKKMNVGLMHPCFDNIVDLLKHMQVPITALQEDWFHDPETIYEKLEANVTSDAIFLIDPNNPTGFTLFKFGTAGWNEVIRFAVDKKKLLICVMIGHDARDGGAIISGDVRQVRLGRQPVAAGHDFAGLSAAFVSGPRQSK